MFKKITAATAANTCQQQKKSTHVLKFEMLQAVAHRGIRRESRQGPPPHSAFPRARAVSKRHNTTQHNTTQHKYTHTRTQSNSTKEMSRVLCGLRLGQSRRAIHCRRRGCRTHLEDAHQVCKMLLLVLQKSTTQQTENDRIHTPASAPQHTDASDTGERERETDRHRQRQTERQREEQEQEQEGRGQTHTRTHTRPRAFRSSVARAFRSCAPSYRASSITARTKRS